MHPQIKTAIVKASSFTELAPIVEKAREDISFFGRRYIYVQEYDGTLSINALAVKVMVLVGNIDFSKQPNEYTALEQIRDKINDIYKENDARWKNPITLIPLLIRDAKYAWDEYNNGKSKGIRFCWKTMYIENLYDKSSNLSQQRHCISPWILSQDTKEEIQTVLPNTTLTDLLPIVEKARPEVSFFGCRYISVQGYDGTLPIDALSLRVVELVKKALLLSQNLEYEKIKPFINKIYDQSYDRFRERNPLTRTFCAIRKIWSLYLLGKNDVSRLQWEIDKNEIHDMHEHKE